MSSIAQTRSLGRQRTVPAGYWFAAIGAVLLAFEIYILAKWVAGPNFVRVPYGPSEPPEWMKWGMEIYQPLGILLIVWMLWSLLFRPWMREGRVPIIGLMVPALVLTSVYDCSSEYFHDWFGYNAYFLNYGSPLPGGIPGWQGFAEPGAMPAWPVIMIPTAYPLLFIFTAWACMKFMQALRGRFPRMPGVALVLLCLFVALLLDILCEGYLMMLLGWYVETGRALNEGEYYQLPWRNALFASVVFTTMGSLLFFRDDAGMTFVERGLDRLPRNSAGQIALRALAVLAATELTLILCYHVPVAFHEKYFPGHWPEAIASQSYFNDHMCGPETPRPCHVNPEGR